MLISDVDAASGLAPAAIRRGSAWLGQDRPRLQARFFVTNSTRTPPVASG
jgi:hypothetical protein